MPSLKMSDGKVQYFEDGIVKREDHLEHDTRVCRYSDLGIEHRIICPGMATGSLPRM